MRNLPFDWTHYCRLECNRSRQRMQVTWCVDDIDRHHVTCNVCVTSASLHRFNGTFITSLVRLATFFDLKSENRGHCDDIIDHYLVHLCSFGTYMRRVRVSSYQNRVALLCDTNKIVIANISTRYSVHFLAWYFEPIPLRNLRAHNAHYMVFSGRYAFLSPSQTQ